MDYISIFQRKKEPKLLFFQDNSITSAVLRKMLQERLLRPHFQNQEMGLSQKELDAIFAEVTAEVATAVADARTDPYPADSELFNDFYVEGGVR